MRVFIGFLLVLTLWSFAVKDIDGGYISESGIKEGYYFWSDSNEFIWFRFTDEARELGRGRFKLSNDSITLNFGSARKQFDVEEKKRFVNRGEESIVVNYNNHLNEPIEGLEITLKKMGIKAVTGKDGLAILDIKNSKVDEDEIDIGIGDYRTYQQSLNLKGQSYHFKVTADSGRTYKENQIMNLHFKMTKNEISLTDNQTVKTFRHVTRNRFMDLYHAFKR